MDEFEAGSKRIKRTETTEKTVYNSKEFTEKERDKLKVAPIGGKIKKTKKRDIKDGIKSKNYKYKNETEDKEELTEQIKELKRFYNQLRVKTGELKPNIEQRTELVNNCLQIIGNDFKKYAFKHDSCRVLQCMLKRGSADQKKLIIDKLTELFVELCTNKYSHYLAKKIVKYCTDEDQRKKLVSAVLNKMEKLVNHMFASDIIEELYSNGSMKEKKQLVRAFYGKYFLILEQNKGKSLRNILKEKESLKDQILSQLEEITHKFIDKGLMRHTIVQAIIYDYVSICSDEQQNELLQMLIDHFPSLLGSKPGLKVACGLFAIASTKERRTIVKTVKPLVNEMAVNPISSLFLAYICLRLDDTVLSKKSIMNSLVKIYEEIKEDKFAMILYSLLLTGIEHPIRNVITKAKHKCMFFNYLKTTSKKDEAVRRKEILVNLVDEICNQAEKNLIEELTSNRPFVITSLLFYCIEQNECEEFLESVYRCLQKQITAYNDGKKIPVVAHSSVHRLIKEMMVYEINLKKENPERNLHFTESIATILKKDIETHLIERSVFLLATIVQNDESKHLITKTDITMKMIKSAMKKTSNNTGIRLLKNFMYGNKEGN